MKNNSNTKNRTFRICIVVVIIVLAVSFIFFYLIDPKVPLKESMTCLPNSQWCVFVVTDNGGATTSFYNRVYSYNTETSSKKLLFAVDKALPSQIKLQWNSAQKISVVVPSCSLIEHRSKENNLTIIIQEGVGSNVVDCNS